MFERMRRKEVDILLGTQMIAKGLDFPDVTLVGIVSADVAINIPDFRAAERTFQLLTQVAGRSGRGSKPGKVMIQTYNPGHYAIKWAVKVDYRSFAEYEMKNRHELFYSPVSRMARLEFAHKGQQYLKEAMMTLLPLIEFLNQKTKTAKILGPTPAPFQKLHGKFRWHLIIKAESSATLANIIDYINENSSLPSAITRIIDVDPASLL